MKPSERLFEILLERLQCLQGCAVVLASPIGIEEKADGGVEAPDSVLSADLAGELASMGLLECKHGSSYICGPVSTRISSFTRGVLR